ncbi:MAG: hypothetical protein OEM49_12295 [Myxococcales bacterium]|nr:hypothetical protein [Myxococcales bacterium]MDH5565544.1 hypothetical protein [Myxococcales bacterium]
MQRLHLLIVAGLLFIAPPAWADGPFVRWERIEGVLGADVTPLAVGDIGSSTRWRTTGSGQALINPSTRFAFFTIRGLSWTRHYPNAPLGSPASGSVMGTFVCDSTGRHGPAIPVDTQVIEMTQGSGIFWGFVDVPEGCRERPEETVFLLRHANPGPLYGLIVAYGSGRTIR